MNSGSIIIALGLIMASVIFFYSLQKLVACFYKFRCCRRIGIHAA